MTFTRTPLSSLSITATVKHLTGLTQNDIFFLFKLIGTLSSYILAYYDFFLVLITTGINLLQVIILQLKSTNGEWFCHQAYK